MPAPTNRARRRPAPWLIAATLLVTGCAAPAPDPSLVGSRTRICGDRVDTTQAEAVTGREVATLRELSTFEPGRRVGTCALRDPDGAAVLAVEVVHDPQGKALGAELEQLSTEEHYQGDDSSGVTGDGRSTTALRAIDDTSYVRVLGLGGTSEHQRSAAAGLAQDLATRSATLK